MIELNAWAILTARKAFCSIALICMGLSQSVQAQSASVSTKQLCSPGIVGAVGESLKIKDFTYGNGGTIVSDVCKVWPKDETITLVAIAYRATSVDVLNLAVAMIDNGRNEVIATYKEMLGKQADIQLGRDGLSIDTARYDVTKGTRAFGVDVTRGTIMDWGESGLGRVRNLYVLDGNEIRPIIKGFYLSYWRFAPGSNLGWVNSETAVTDSTPAIETITLKIAISKSLTNDYFDLSIFSVSSYDDGFKSNREPFQYKLKFDGKQYPLNEMNKAYLKWLR
ncbi:MAG: hypothetical protein HZB47_01040 [Nitrosomonadales bacterium]|nr:hypothetical protein [Nitrosomonadales bacterium]